MVMSSDALADRMTRWDIGNRRSHLLVSLLVLCCATMRGQRDSSFCIRVATFLSIPVSPEWSFGAAVTGVGWGARC